MLKEKGSQKEMEPRRGKVFENELKEREWKVKAHQNVKATQTILKVTQYTHAH